jgi:hypothetical protein
VRERDRQTIRQTAWLGEKPLTFIPSSHPQPVPLQGKGKEEEGVLPAGSTTAAGSFFNVGYF